MSTFSNFISSVYSIVRRKSDHHSIVSAVAPLMKDLVLDRTWLNPRYTNPLAGQAYAQYLLHRADDQAFSVVSFVWNPSQGSPIHDHGGTWGVIGQYDGEEEETRYKCSHDGKLEVVQTLVARPGDVSHVYPPNRDIHRILNTSKETPAISIHVYGCDVGTLARLKYDSAMGRAEHFVSGYDSSVKILDRSRGADSKK